MGVVLEEPTEIGDLSSWSTVMTNCHEQLSGSLNGTGLDTLHMCVTIV